MEVAAHVVPLKTVPKTTVVFGDEKFPPSCERLGGDLQQAGGGKIVVRNSVYERRADDGGSPYELHGKSLPRCDIYALLFV